MEFHALGQVDLAAPVDRVGLPAHVHLPASLPDSRPPPVSFSPPNAPPISAPEVPMFTLAMPQSLPGSSGSLRLADAVGEDRGAEALRHVVVQLQRLREASCTSSRRGSARRSRSGRSAPASISMIVGCTKCAARSRARAPYRRGAPCPLLLGRLDAWPRSPPPRPRRSAGPSGSPDPADRRCSPSL